MMAHRIAYCKVHYPLAYYAAYFSIRAPNSTPTSLRAADYVGQQIKSSRAWARRRSSTPSRTPPSSSSRAPGEHRLRAATPASASTSPPGADKFIIDGNALLPPIAALAGMARRPRWGHRRARKEGAFTSIEDLRRRSGISKTNIEILAATALDGMSE